MPGVTNGTSGGKAQKPSKNAYRRQQKKAQKGREVCMIPSVVFKY